MWILRLRRYRLQNVPMLNDFPPFQSEQIHDSGAARCIRRDGMQMDGGVIAVNEDELDIELHVGAGKQGGQGFDRRFTAIGDTRIVLHIVVGDESFERFPYPSLAVEEIGERGDDCTILVHHELTVLNEVALSVSISGIAGSRQ